MQHGESAAALHSVAQGSAVVIALTEQVCAGASRTHERQQKSAHLFAGGAWRRRGLRAGGSGLREAGSGGARRLGAPDGLRK